MTDSTDQPTQPTPTGEQRKKEKPLFIPLNRAYFEAFADGTKVEELRRYGTDTGWHEGTCRVGRAVTLSLGHGKQHRLTGRIWAFRKQHGSLFGSTYKAAILDVYETLDVYIAVISIKDIEPVEIVNV